MERKEADSTVGVEETAERQEFMKKIFFLCSMIACSAHLIAYEMSDVFQENFLKYDAFRVTMSLGRYGCSFIIKVDSVYKDGVLCKVYFGTNEEKTFHGLIWVTNTKENLVTGQDLPTNTIVCRHKYYIKPREGTSNFPYKCNKCACGIENLSSPPPPLRGWRFYRDGVKKEENYAIPKFSMKPLQK